MSRRISMNQMHLSCGPRAIDFVLCCKMHVPTNEVYGFCVELESGQCSQVALRVGDRIRRTKAPVGKLTLYNSVVVGEDGLVRWTRVSAGREEIYR